MSTNLPTDLAALRALPYNERMAALRERTATALHPQTEQERVVVEWLQGLDSPTMESIVAMIERRDPETVADAYDRGFAEGVEHARARQSSHEV